MEHHIEQFYYVAWAEDDGFFLSPAATLIKKTLFTQVRPRALDML